MTLALVAVESGVATEHNWRMASFLRSVRAPAAIVMVTVTVGFGGGAAAASDRVFTVAGGGGEGPREGMSATEARLVPSAVAIAEDGQIVVAGNRADLWTVGSDGRLHAVPAAFEQVDDVDAEPGGSLLAVADGELWRLAPAASSWNRLFVAPPARAPALNAAQPERVTHMGDGRILLGGNYLSWILDHDGRVLETFDRGGDEGVAALRDGGIALMSNSSGLAVRRMGDRFRDGGHGFDAAIGDLAGLPDGDLLVANYGVLYRVDGRLQIHEFVRRRPGLGVGDGDRLARAVISPAALASRPGGGLVFIDATEQLLRGEFTAWAIARSGGLVPRTEPLNLGADVGLVRLVEPAPIGQPLLALTDPTFRTLARGSVSYRSTFAGPARLRIERKGRIVADVTFAATVGAGQTTVPHLRTPATTAYRSSSTMASIP